MPKLFQENERIFNTLFEAISEGVIAVDENQIIIAANNAAELMFGYDKNELNSKHLNTLIPSSYHANHGNHFKDFFDKSTKRKMGVGRDIFGLRKDSTKFPIEAGLNPFKIDNKTYVLSILTDITLRKQQEKEIFDLNTKLEEKINVRTEKLKDTVVVLEKEIEKRILAENKIKDALKKEKELNELKTKFLSLVSHEFKTPLSGILNSTVLIGKYTDESMQDKRVKHLNTIKNKVFYLNNILNDFLSVERLESGKVNYKFNHFMLSKVVNEVIYNANMLLKRSQNIIYPSNIDGYEIYQDEKILELALTNLINNAIKYSPEGTDILLEVTFDNNFITFTVADKGIGIPKKDQKYIFNRYYRASNALTNQGTGIGLNIIEGHLNNLGGTIHFKSKENEGSSFIIKLPLRKES